MATSTNSIPATQKAWIIANKGHPSKALSFKTDYPVPAKLGKDEVLVKIQAAALNPVGYKLMGLVPNFAAGRPFPAENDFAGVVVDANGTAFKNGDSVWGFIDVPLAQKVKQGALQEYARVPANNIVPRPDSISTLEAAGLALAGQTAYQCLREAKLESGQTVLINGGSSSVGAFAIQIAKAQGLKVVATASGKNEEFVKKLGADEFVDYKKEPLHEHFTKNPPSPKFHGIVDAVGLCDPSLYNRSQAYLAPGSVYVSTGPWPRSLKELTGVLKLSLAWITPTFLGGPRASFRLAMLAHKKEDIEAMNQLIAEGKLKGVVDSVHSFDDVLPAYERLMTGRAQGKVVIKVDPTIN